MSVCLKRCFSKVLFFFLNTFSASFRLKTMIACSKSWVSVGILLFSNPSLAADATPLRCHSLLPSLGAKGKVLILRAQEKTRNHRKSVGKKTNPFVVERSKNIKKQNQVRSEKSKRVFSARSHSLGCRCPAADGGGWSH